MIVRATWGALLMVTTGCTPLPPSAAEEENLPVHGESGGRCDVARAQALVGRAASAELGAEALRLTGSKALRWITPGAIVTMDYREDRLNIDLDARNRVTRLRCG